MRWLLLLALLLMPLSSEAAIAQVQCTSLDGATADGSNQVTYSPGSTTTAGNAYVLGVFHKGNVTVSVSGGGTWVDSGLGRVARPTDGYSTLLGVPNLSAVSSFTLTFSAAPDAASVYAYGCEYSGARTSGLFASGASSGTAVSPDTSVSASHTPPISAGAVVGFSVIGNTLAGTVGASYTERLDTSQGVVFQDRIFSSELGAQTVTVSHGADVVKALMLAATIHEPEIVGCYLMENNTDFYLMENNTDKYALEGGDGGLCGGAPPAATYPGWYSGGGWY